MITGSDRIPAWEPFVDVLATLHFVTVSFWFNTSGISG